MNLIERLVYYYRRWRYREKPIPRISVTAGPTVPAAIVRLAAVLAAVVCVALAGNFVAWPGVMVTVLTVAIGLWMLLRPGFEVACVAICLAGICLTVSSRTSLQVSVPVIVVTGYLALRLSMLAALTHRRGRVCVAVILNWRDAAILGLTALVGAATYLPGRGSWLVLAGAVAVVVVALVVSRRTASSTDADQSPSPSLTAAAPKLS